MAPMSHEMIQKTWSPKREMDHLPQVLGLAKFKSHIFFDSAVRRFKYDILDDCEKQRIGDETFFLHIFSCPLHYYFNIFLVVY